MSLQLGALADVLQQLEQTVNNALLKLVLEVVIILNLSIPYLGDIILLRSFWILMAQLVIYSLGRNILT